MARKRATIANPQPARLMDFSGGMNNVVQPAMLNDNESVLLQNYSMDEKGTLLPIKGRKARYVPGTIPGPLNGMAAYHRSDGVSRLLIGSGHRLYIDTPRLVDEFDSQADWETGEREFIDTASTPGSIKPVEPLIETEETKEDFEIPGDMAWDVNTGFVSGSGTNQNTVGWRFKVLKEGVFVTDLAFRPRYTGEHILSLWTLAGERLLKRFITVDVSNEWVTLPLDVPPIPLQKYEEYVVSYYRTSTTTTNYRISDPSPEGFNDAVEFIEGRFIGSEAFPTSTSSLCFPANFKFVIEEEGILNGVAATPNNDVALMLIKEDGWLSPGSPSTTEYASNRSLGWRFKSEKNQLVTAFRIHSRISRTNLLRLWAASEIPEILAEASIYSTSSDGWVTVQLSVPVILEKNKEYVICTVDYPAYNYVYYANSPSASLFNQSKITFVGGRYGFGTNFPGTSTTHACFVDVVLAEYVTEGYRISPVIDPSAVGIAGGSKIEWEETLNGQTLIVETRLSDDEGVSWGYWQAATSGGSIPGLTEGLSLTDYRLQTRATLATTDVDATPRLHSISLVVYPRSVWISPVLDVSNASDKESGQITLELSTPGGSTVTIESRSASDPGGPWTSWVAASGDGMLNHVADDYVQLRLRLTADGDNLSSVDKATVNFDGAPSVELLAEDFNPGGQFFFGSLLDTVAVVNSIDAPRKLDGDELTLLGGNPPRGTYVVAHKNRLWMLRGSRLYFSDLLNIEEWPILNFIDISPNDGDTGTGLHPADDYLVITKKRSIWILVGDSIDTFAVRRISSSRGNIAARSLLMLDKLLCFVSDDGVYFSDFSQTVHSSERLRQTWNEINHRRLNQAVSWFAKQKLYISLPGAGSARNDTVLVFDAIRQSWYIIKDWHVSCATEWDEAGRQVVLLGHSNEGQASELNSGQNNAGEAIDAIWESKHFDAGFPEILKRFRRTTLNVTPDIQGVVLEVSYIVDGGDPTDPIYVTVPARTDKRTEVIQVEPAVIDVHYARSLGYRIRQNTLNAAVGIRSISQEFYPTRDLPTIRA